MRSTAAGRTTSEGRRLNSSREETTMRVMISQALNTGFVFTGSKGAGRGTV